MFVILQLLCSHALYGKGCSYTTTRLDGTPGVVVLQTLFRSNNSSCSITDAVVIQNTEVVLQQMQCALEIQQ